MNETNEKPLGHSLGFRERHGIPDLGVGIGFRVPHARQILSEEPEMDWFEIISENFFVGGGRPKTNLDRLRSCYPLVPHGVSLGIGDTRPLDASYLGSLGELLGVIDPPWFSDHLCWSGAAGHNLHDLLPLPHASGLVEHVAARIREVQERLERPMAIENVSSYMAFAESDLTEWEFLARVAEAADSGILLDVNNIYVSAFNHGFDAHDYIDAIDPSRVVQIHLAGHTHRGTHILDTHSDHVKDEVWELYRYALGRVGAVSTLIEWDEQIPAFEIVAEEAALAKRIKAEVVRGAEVA